MTTLERLEGDLIDAKEALDCAQKELNAMKREEKREPAEGWGKVPTDTLIEVRDSKNGVWKCRRFCCYMPNSNAGEFMCFTGSGIEAKSQTESSSIVDWKYARLIID